MNTINANDIKFVFDALNEVMDENRNHLIKIDATIGDGDLGITMQKGFKAANEQLKIINDTDIGLLLSKAGMTIAQAAPSTMGTLIGTGFIKAGKVLKNRKEASVSDFAEAMDQFLEGIMSRGKAKPGDKTIIDSLHPATNALKSAAKEGKSFEEAMQISFEAALEGLEATKEMIPQHGKQVVHREKSKGLHDPGATVGMLIMKTFADYFQRK
ncbi:MAG: dihydroxyacetone kinase subunit DhaL [bacterium]